MYHLLKCYHIAYIILDMILKGIIKISKHMNIIIYTILFDY